MVAESRRHEIVHLEAMWHVNLEPLPQVLQQQFAFERIKHQYSEMTRKN
jgi:hypothetical protein